VGWSPDVVIVFWGGVSSFFLGHSYKILNISSESSAQAQSIATFLSELGKRVGLWTFPKSQRHTDSVQAAG